MVRLLQLVVWTPPGQPQACGCSACPMQLSVAYLLGEASRIHHHYNKSNESKGNEVKWSEVKWSEEKRRDWVWELNKPYLLNFCTRARHLSMVSCICSLKLSQSPLALSMRYPACSSTLDMLLLLWIPLLIPVRLLRDMEEQDGDRALILWTEKDTNDNTTRLQKCSKLMDKLLVCLWSCSCTIMQWWLHCYCAGVHIRWMRFQIRKDNKYKYVHTVIIIYS